MELNVILEQFLKSPDFKAGIIASTRASWKGGAYSVKLFEERGVWEVAWNDRVNGFDDGPGVVLRLPTLSDEDYAQSEKDGMSEQDFFDAAFANEEDDLAQELRDALAEAL